MAEFLPEYLAMVLEMWMHQQMAGQVEMRYLAELVHLLKQLVVNNEKLNKPKKRKWMNELDGVYKRTHRPWTEGEWLLISVLLKISNYYW